MVVCEEYYNGFAIMADFRAKIQKKHNLYIREGVNKNNSIFFYALPYS